MIWKISGFDKFNGLKAKALISARYGNRADVLSCIKQVRWRDVKDNDEIEQNKFKLFFFIF